MRNFLNLITKTILTLLSSKWTPWCIVSLFILNTLWVALFYRYPLVFDENFHFQTIQAFTHTLWPAILDQPEKYDHLGSLAFGSASLYHYILSFPLRFVELFTTDLRTQIVSLRLINVALAASGLLLYYKLFRELGIKKYLINTGLLVFAFIPLATYVAATINYDNILLPLTALFFIYSNRLLAKKGKDTLLVIKVLTVGTLATLIKFTFLPLFVVALCYLAIVLIKDNGNYKKYWSLLIKSFKQIALSQKIVWISLLAFLLTLAGVRYGASMVLYKSPIPDCSLIMKLERCEKNANYKISRAALRDNSKAPVANPASYVQNWFKTMAGGFAMTGANTPFHTNEAKESPPIYSTALTAGLITGMIILLYMWRSLKFDRRYTFTLLCAIGLLGFTLLFNMLSYYQYRVDINVQPRYALSVLLIIVVFSTVAVNALLRQHRTSKVLLLIGLLCITVQGGGAITHIISSKPYWYWDGDSAIQEIQSDAHKALQPVVKEEIFYVPDASEK